MTVQFGVTALNTVGETAATSRGTAITADAVANTKGAWAEITASSPVAAHALVVNVGRISAASDCLIDLGTGAAGSEVVVLANLLQTMVSAAHATSFLLPLAVPAGTRIAARMQSATGGTTVDMSLVLVESSGTDVTAIETGGAVTADSGGTSIDPGAVAHTKGAWTQLIASTATIYEWLLVAIGNQNNAARTGMDFLIDIGVGAAAAEVVTVADLYGRVPGSGALRPFPDYYVIPVTIAAGSRIAARMQSSITDATDRTLDVVTYGVNGAVAGGGGGGVICGLRRRR